jgi:hypothetical protein
MKSWKMNEKKLTLQMDESCKRGWNLFKNFVGFLKLDCASSSTPGTLSWISNYSTFKYNFSYFTFSQIFNQANSIAKQNERISILDKCVYLMYYPYS